MLKYNGSILKVNNGASTLDYAPPPYDPVVNDFYYLTYFLKNDNGTIRTYQNGQRVDVAPTSSSSYYKFKTENYGTGTINYISATSTNSSGYTANYTLTSAQQDAWKVGALQYEYIFHFTSWSSSGTIIPLEELSYMHKLDWQSSRFEFLMHCSDPNYAQSSITSKDSRWSTFTNYEWISFQSSSSNWPAGTYHLVCTLDFTTKKTLFWINGILQGVVVWNDTFINNRKSQMSSNCTLRFNTNQLASTVWISQMGIRPAVWTEEQDYTPLSKPYMSVDEYF